MLKLAQPHTFTVRGYISTIYSTKYIMNEHQKFLTLILVPTNKITVVLNWVKPFTFVVHGYMGVHYIADTMFNQTNFNEHGHTNVIDFVNIHRTLQIP